MKKDSEKLNLDVDDIIAGVGLVALSAGAYNAYGWEVAAMIIGAILLSIGVWRAK